MEQELHPTLAELADPNSPYYHLDYEKVNHVGCTAFEALIDIIDYLKKNHPELIDDVPNVRFGKHVITMYGHIHERMEKNNNL